jgi:multidrug resistance efflux pump
VQIVIPEKEIGDVRVGERVVLRSRAYPNAVFEGAVTAIATSAEGLATAGGEAAVAKATNGGRNVTTFIVTTQIDNHAGLLKPGMTGLAKVLCGERRLIDLITRRLARTFRVEFWSWW